MHQAAVHVFRLLDMGINNRKTNAPRQFENYNKSLHALLLRREIRDY